MPKYQCEKCGALYAGWAKGDICQKCGGKLKAISREKYYEELDYKEREHYREVIKSES